MKPKQILLSILAMSFSFSVVLVFMVSLASPPPPAKTRTKKTTKHRTQLRPAAPLADRRIAQPTQLPTTKTKNPAPEPTQPAPPITPIQQQHTKPVRATPPAGFAATSEEIQLFKKELRKQITALEQNRNNMITQLARKLAVTPPVKAAAEIRGLDDETAALVLKNMSASPRLKLLKHLDHQQAQRLNRHVRKL